MGGARISRDEILKACEEVSKTGEKVTNESVRDFLGRGSYPTIGPVVKYFKDVLKNQMTGVAINPDVITKHVPHQTQYVPMTNIPRYMGHTPSGTSLGNRPAPHYLQAPQNPNVYRDYYSAQLSNSNLAHNLNFDPVATSQALPSEAQKIAQEFAQKIWSVAQNTLSNQSNDQNDQEKDAFINELHQELDNLRSTYARLESEVKILRDVNQKLDGHLRKKNSEVFIFNKQLFKKEADIKDLVDRCARAEQELQIMKDRYPAIEKTKTILKKRPGMDDFHIESTPSVQPVAQETLVEEKVIQRPVENPNVQNF